MPAAWCTCTAVQIATRSNSTPRRQFRFSSPSLPPRFLAALQSFKFNDLEWSLWDRWILEGDLTVNQVSSAAVCCQLSLLGRSRAKRLEAYSTPASSVSAPNHVRTG